MTKTEMMVELKDLERELAELDREILKINRRIEECRQIGDDEEAEYYEFDKTNFVAEWNETAEEIRRLQKKMKERYC